MNARADQASGFVWRMQTEDGDATAVRGCGGDPRLIINLTVWESLEAMRAFVYEDREHLAVMRRRREWSLTFRRHFDSPDAAVEHVDDSCLCPA